MPSPASIEDTKEHPVLDSGPGKPLVVEASGVSVVLEHTPILHGVDAGIYGSSLTGLVGPNGSGKTTLLRAVSGLIPYRGMIRLLGRPIQSWKPRDLAKRLAFVRQSVSLSFDFNVSELVLLGRSPHLPLFRDYGPDDLEHVRNALERVDLGGFGDRSVLSLSGGELQRVFLAQALVQEADILVLDEPTAHLDVHYQFEFMDLVRQFVDGGGTAVVVFHDLELAARYADHVIALNRGRVVNAGRPTDVITESLLAEVFRMSARVVQGASGGLSIRYDRPIHSFSTPG